MIEEAYVTFETAKLLRNKGFNEITSKSYPVFDNDKFIEDIPCPTLQMAMQWLRKMYQIFIQIVPSDGLTKFRATIYYNNTDFIQCNWYFNTPEEVIEDTIKYCLEHLI